MTTRSFLQMSSSPGGKHAHHSFCINDNLKHQFWPSAVPGVGYIYTLSRLPGSTPQFSDSSGKANSQRDWHEASAGGCHWLNLALAPHARGTNVETSSPTSTSARKTDRIYKMGVPAFAKQIQENHQLSLALHHTRDKEVEEALVNDLIPDVGKHHLLLIATVGVQHTSENPHTSAHGNCDWLLSTREFHRQSGCPEAYCRGPLGVQLPFNYGSDACLVDPLTPDAEDSP